MQEMTRGERWMVWAGRTVSLVPVFIVLMSSRWKLTSNPWYVQEWGRIGWKPEDLPFIASLQLGAILLYVIPRTSVLGAVLLTGYLGGAIASYVRIGELNPPLVPLTTALFAWLGIFLRDKRLRELLPFRTRTTKLQAIVLLTAFLALEAAAQDSKPFADDSPHKAQFVSVGAGVQLEVLDWGGTGRPIVFLAGYLTSHAYDEIAPKLVDIGHVYAITRRGLGASSKPTTGYTAERSAEDVLRVLDSLALQKPILVGHSFGGQDLTTLGAMQPGRMSALVYLDSAEDTTLEPVGTMDPDKLPEALRANIPEDKSSFSAYQKWQREFRGFAFPESELRQIFAANPDGSVGRYLVSKQVRDDMFAGLRAPEYSRIRVPVLAFFALPLLIEDQIKLYKPQTVEEGVALGLKYGLDLARFAQQKDALKSGVPSARVVELVGAKSYIFLTNQADVIRELRAFIAELPGDAR